MARDPKPTTPPKRDFAAVVRRARSVDPDRIPEQMVDEADQRDHAITRPPSEPAIDIDPQLSVFVDAARRSLLDAPSPTGRTAGRGGPPLWAVAGTVLALAAAAALAWNIRSASWKPGAATSAQVEYSAQERDTKVGETRPSKSSGAAGLASAARPSPPKDPSPPAAAAESPPDPEASTEPSPPPSTPKKNRPSSSAKQDRLAKLDAEAQAAWKEGRLADAERLFRQILSIAPGSHQADLALGDLLALAHRRGDRAAERALRRRYLREFPKGQFADDVRAASCRAETAESRSCWREYLDAHPSGAYRREAQRVLDASTNSD